jgi:Lon protease-like protein
VSGRQLQAGQRVPDIEGAALAALPIFPLPEVVLFPGTLLPLHVFEERYRELTRDALEGHQLLAMTRLRTDHPAADPDRPPVYPIAGIGEIQASRETEDGRYYLVLRGLARIAIREELPLERSYRRVRAALLPDLPSERPELVTACESQLISLCDRLAGALPDADELRDLVREARSPGERADLVAGALISDADERQSLLETLDPADRLERLIELVADALAELGVELERN